MGIVDLAFMQGYIRMATDGVNMGWHERNGGNLTYRLTKEEVEQARPYFSDGKPWVEIGVEVKNLAGEYFLATGTGKFLRNVQLAPQDNVCIAEIDKTGTKYRIVWGLEKGGAPTSEFPSHLMNHSVKFDVTGGKHRVIYHAHTPAVIAMTNVLELDDVKWTRALWSAMTECPVVFPGGVGVLPWMVCGGAEIAKATSELMKQYDVAIWAFHGTFASGKRTACFVTCNGLDTTNVLKLHDKPVTVEVYILHILRRTENGSETDVVFIVSVTHKHASRLHIV